MSILKKLIKRFYRKDYEFVWRQFALENMGNYFSDLGQDKVEFYYQGYKIVFDTYTHYINVDHNSYESNFLRAFVEFKSYDKLKFRLTKQGFIDTIAIFFGAQDILIEDKSFDKKFMLKGNDEFKIQLIFSNHSIQQLLLNQELIRLDLTDGEGLFGEKAQDGNMMLYYISDKKLTTIDQLYELKTFIEQMLDVLTKNGSAKAT